MYTRNGIGNDDVDLSKLPSKRNDEQGFEFNNPDNYLSYGPKQTKTSWLYSSFSWLYFFWWF